MSSTSSESHNVCYLMLNFSYGHINIFNAVCCIILFITLGKSCRATCQNLLKSDKYTPENFRGQLSQITSELLSGLLKWNIFWMLFQILLIFFAVWKQEFLWIIIGTKAFIWYFSIYLELSTTFFTYLPLDRLKWFKYVKYTVQALAFLSGAGCLIIDVYTVTPSSDLYYHYDLGWCIFRVLLVFSLYFYANAAQAQAEMDADAAQTPKTGRMWAFFMVISYILESILQIYHLTDSEGSACSCMKMVVKAFYFTLFAPALEYTMNMNSLRWCAVMNKQFDAAWSKHVADLYHPGEKKVKSVAKSLNTIRFSSLYDYYVNEKDLLYLNVEIGKGSFGSVKLYKHLQRNEIVAIKFISATALLESDDNEAVIRFKREFIYFLESQSCPYIVKLIGLFFQVDTNCPRVGIVLEYAKYGTLDSILPFNFDISGGIAVSVPITINGASAFDTGANSSVEGKKKKESPTPAPAPKAIEMSVGGSGGSGGSRSKSFSHAPPVVKNFNRVASKSLSSQENKSAKAQNAHNITDIKSRTPTTWPRHPFSLSMHYAEGLKFLHEKLMYIFTDLKPSNLVLTGDYKGKLIDLGSISQTVNKICCAEVCSQLKQLKQQNEFLEWTDAYCDPELLLARKSGNQCIVSPQTDSYSFAFILWHLATGMKTPFVIDSDVSRDSRGEKKTRVVEFSSDVILYYHTKKLRPPLPKSLPDSAKNLIQDCWHSDSKSRPTMSTICERLVDVIRDVEKYYYTHHIHHTPNGSDFQFINCFFPIEDIGLTLKHN